MRQRFQIRLPEGFRPDVVRQNYVREGLATKRWEKFCGPLGAGVAARHPGEVPGDGNVYDHQRRQATLVRNYGWLDVDSPALAAAKLMAPDARLSKKAWMKMRVLSLLHDVGETTSILADVTYDAKLRETPHQREEREGHETAMAMKFIRKAAQGYPSVSKQAIEIISIEKDPANPYGKIFKAYEKLSYLWGAVAAFRGADKMRAHGGRPMALVRNVLGNQIPAMADWARAGVPSFQAFLRDYGPDVDAMFAACDAYPTRDFTRDTAEMFQGDPADPGFTPESEEAALAAKYAKARDAWAAWKAFDARPRGGTMGGKTTA